MNTKNPPVGSVYNEPTVPPLTLKIPDTGYPPKKEENSNPEPYLSEHYTYPPLSLNLGVNPNQDQTNWLALAPNIDNTKTLQDQEGWTAEKDPPLSETDFSDKIEKQRDKYLHPDGEIPSANVRIVDDLTTKPKEFNG